MNKFQGAVASAKTGPASSSGLVAVPWTAAEHVPAAATALSGGSGFGVLLSTAGEVFTWGDSNKWGELGLGGRVVGDVGTQKKGTPLEQSVVAQATGSLLAKNVKHVAAGSAHAMAVSESGTLYAWGRGFEGQTGLVGEPIPKATDAPRVAGEQTKPPGVVLSPKLVKFSSEQPVATVACGHNFTVAIVKQGGVLYAWGEGGCGQLGIGRCKKYVERPTPCDPSAVKRTSRKPGGSTSSAAPKFVDVSCGWAHVLARNANDEVYVWGLNAHGQLGLGHTDAVNHPVMLTSPFAETPGGEGAMDVTDSALDSSERPPLYLRDISAYGSGSAGVRPDGRVLSWGSNRTGRLGHPNDDSNTGGPEGNENSGSSSSNGGGRCFLEPKLVDGIAGQRISMVKLAAEELVAFAPTTLVRLEPAAGPMQGNSRFVIAGSGLWASDNIVVKFEPVPGDVLARMHPEAEFEAFPRARSTIGKFHVDPFTGAQTISCRTPNMADTQKSLKKLMAAYGGADGTGGANGSSGDGGGGGNSGGKSSAPSSPTKAPFLARQTSVGGSKAAAGSIRESKQPSGGALSPRGQGQFESGPQPPHPQPMTISVSMNGIDFVPVGEKLADSGKGGLRDGKKSNKGRNALVSRDGESGSGSRAASHADAMKKSLQLRSHGMGPELKHRLVYNFYAFAPFQLTTVHPRLLTLPPPSSSPRSVSNEPPVYLYIGGFGLYETNSIGVRLTAPGKKPIVCTATDVVWLEAGAIGEGSDPSGANDDSPNAAVAAAAANNNNSSDNGDGVEGAPSTGVYVRVKLNDVIRELEAAGSLPFETSSIAVALNGQDFLALQGARDDNSVMLYRAKLDSFYPLAVPAIAPPDPLDSDPNGFGVPLTLKGSGFFRVDKRASCGDKTWHLKLRLAEDQLAEPNSADSAAEGTAVTPGQGFERQPSLKSDTSDDLAVTPGGEAGVGAGRGQRRAKKAAPEVLVPCRFEDNFTLTALLPPFPLRGGYLQAFNRRARGATKTGATPSSSFSSSASASQVPVSWPSPWPSVANFTTEIVMARDIGNLSKLWEQKIKDGVVALPPPQALSSSKGSSNDQFAPSLALESSSTTTTTGLAPLCVYSLPGMGIGAAGPMALTLTRAAGSFACGQLVEFVPTDPAQIALFASAHNQPGQAKVRFAFCSPDGTAFVRSFPAAASAATAKELKKAPAPVPVEQDEGAGGGDAGGGGSLAGGSSIAGSGGGGGSVASGGNDFENASLGGDDFSVVSSVGGRAALGDPNDPLLEVNDDDDDEMRESKLAEQARRREALQAYDDAQTAEAAELERAAQASSPLVWYVDVPATVECIDVLEPPVLVLPKPKVDPAAAAAAAAAAEAPPEKPAAKGKGKKPKVPQKSPEEEAAEAAAALAAATDAAAALVRAPPVLQKRWVVRCQAPGLARRMAGGVDFVLPDPEPVNQPNNSSSSKVVDGSGLIASVGNMSSPSGRAASSRAVSRKSARKQQEEDARLAAEEEAARARKRAPPEPWRGMPKRITCRTFVALNGLHFHDWPVAKQSTSSSSSFDGRGAATGGNGGENELVPVDHAAYLSNLALFGDQGGGSMTEGGSVASRGSANSTATKKSAASAAPSAAPSAAASSVGGGGASLASSMGGGSLDGSFDEFANAFLYRGAPPPLHTTVFTYLAYGLPNSVENVSTGGGALRPGSTLSFQGANLSCVPGVTCVRLTEMIYPSDRSEAGSGADDDRSVASSVASAPGHDNNVANDGSDAAEPPAAAAVEGSRSVVLPGVPTNEKGGGVSCVVPDFGVGTDSVLLKAELFLGGMGVVEARGDGERALPTYTTTPLEYIGGKVEEEVKESAIDALQGEVEDDEAAAAT
jgi:alpha-tubulin suppressor-like RCC1 family protein